MRTEKVRELTKDELIAEVEDRKKELFNLRFQLATGQLDNPMRIREVRKAIARAKTILHEMEISAEAEGKA